MTRFAAYFALFASAVTGIADDKADTVKAIQGKWVVESVDLAGDEFNAIEDLKPLLTETLKNWELTFTGTSFQTTRGGLTYGGKILLHPAKAPTAIDFIPDGASERQQVPALYNLSGDRLTLYYSVDWKCRPSDFKPTKETPRLMIVVFKREK